MKTRLFLLPTQTAAYALMRVEKDGFVYVMPQRDCTVSPRGPIPVHPLTLR